MGHLPRIVAAALVLATACSQTETGSGEDRGDRHGRRAEPRMMPVPSRALRRCRSTVRLRDLCPLMMPRVEKAPFAHSDTFNRPPRFHLEWNAPYPGVTRKNSPPRFAHLVVQRGSVKQALGFEWPTAVSAIPEPIPRRREQAVLLGRYSWADREGSLVLAPSYPFGGINGDHLVFTWSEGQDDAVISLHAWVPLADAVTTLQAVVASIP